MDSRRYYFASSLFALTLLAGCAAKILTRQLKVLRGRPDPPVR